MGVNEAPETWVWLGGLGAEGAVSRCTDLLQIAICEMGVDLGSEIGDLGYPLEKGEVS